MALMLCLMIAFIDSFELFHSKTATVSLFVILCLMVVSSFASDYGLVLLVLVLFILSYNISFFGATKSVQKVNSSNETISHA